MVAVATAVAATNVRSDRALGLRLRRRCRRAGGRGTRRTARWRRICSGPHANLAHSHTRHTCTERCPTELQPTDQTRPSSRKEYPSDTAADPPSATATREERAGTAAEREARVVREGRSGRSGVRLATDIDIWPPLLCRADVRTEERRARPRSTHTRGHREPRVRRCSRCIGKTPRPLLPRTPERRRCPVRRIWRV